VCSEHNHGPLTQLGAPRVKQLSLPCQPVSVKQAHQPRQPSILRLNILLWRHYCRLLLLLLLLLLESCLLLPHSQLLLLLRRLRLLLRL
jgi:hypothetical protein